MEIEDKIKKALGNKVEVEEEEEDEGDDANDADDADDANDEVDPAEEDAEDKPLYELSLKENPHFYSSGEEDLEDSDDNDLN